MKKKQLLVIALMCTISAYTQINNVPTTGPVTIGTATPHAGKQLTVNGATKLLSAIEVDGDATIEGQTRLNGIVRMHGLTNYAGEAANLHVMVTDPTGHVTKTSLKNLIAYLMDKESYDLALCSEEMTNRPQWFSGIKKIFSPCDEVNVGIGTQNPNHKLTVMGLNYAMRFLAGRSNASANALFNGFSTNHTQHLLQLGKNVDTERVSFVVKNTGATKITNFGAEPTLHLKNGSGHALVITNNEGSKILQVEDNGLLRGRKMRLYVSGWADYVFEAGYPLQSLENTKAYIVQNGRLPNVPSQKEVEQQGIDVSDMLKIQLEKIEELTLHVIAMNERIAALEAENKELKAKR